MLAIEGRGGLQELLGSAARHGVQPRTRVAMSDSASTIYQAVESGDLTQVEDRLRQRAPHGKGELERSPLHLAVEMQRVDVVRLLLKFSLPVDARDYKKETPLHLACGLGERDIAEALLAAGADVSLRDCYRDLPLHSVASGCCGSGDSRAEIATALVARGCPINDQGNAGRTALWNAVGTGLSQPASVRRYGCLPLIERLLDLGADPEICAQGELGTPLRVALDGGNVSPNARPWPEAFKMLSARRT